MALYLMADGKGMQISLALLEVFLKPLLYVIAITSAFPLPLIRTFSHPRKANQRSPWPTHQKRLTRHCSGCMENIQRGCSMARKAKPSTSVYCLGNLKWNRLMVYKETRAKFVRIGFIQRIGIPMPQLPLAVQFGGDNSFCVVSLLRLCFLGMDCARAWAAVSLLTAWSRLESLDIAKINPNRHHWAWHAHSWAGI